MKLKYYLRGLGVGIVVTAFIMSRTMKTEELTDAQIKLRALELGMVEETVLAQLPQAAPEEDRKNHNLDEDVSKDENEDSSEEIFYTAGEADIIEQGEMSENSEENETVKVTNNEGAESGNDTNEQSQEQEESVQSDIEEGVESQIVQTTSEEMVESYIIIAVEPGNGSETVSRKLYNAGLVESAVQFNRFLVDNGYDRNLVVGNHEIPVGATEEDMAKILCGLQ